MNTMTSPEKQKLYIVMCIGCLECGNDSRVLATCKTWEEASDIAYQKSKTDDYAYNERRAMVFEIEVP